MTLNLTLMQSVHAGTLVPAATSAHGPVGGELARRLLLHLPHVHQHLPLELLRDGLVVFVAVDDAAKLPGASGELTNLAGVQPDPHHGFTVQLTPAGFRVLPEVTVVNALPTSVAYRFIHPRHETWHVGSKELTVLNPVEDRPSIFATPLFTELKDALDHYALALVHECRCFVLMSAWLDDNRLFWAQRPEEQIRRSLEQHLVSSLRNATVEVEHVVDERKEADVLVYWAFSTHAALIECKWLGVSFSESREDGRRKSSRFGSSDAVSGLEQLADYLDRKRKRAAGRSLIGHLVVIDGRRRGVSDPDATHTATVEQLLAYEYAEINWPDELLARADLAAPRRMFCRPRL